MDDRLKLEEAKFQSQRHPLELSVRRMHIKWLIFDHVCLEEGPSCDSSSLHKYHGKTPPSQTWNSILVESPE